MTYRELLSALSKFDEEQLDQDVTIQTSNDEFYPAYLDFTVEGELGDNHPVLITDD